MILKRLQSFHYHKEQIEIIFKAFAGVVIVNLVAPIIFFFGFGEIPLNILYILTGSHLILFTLRISTSTYFLNKLPNADENVTKKYLKMYLLQLFISNTLWSANAIFAVLYADTIHVLMLLTILLAIISGAMSTIGSVFHAMFIYIITIIPTFIFAFAFFGDANIYQPMSLFLVAYLFVMLSSSFKNYQLLEDSITQREKIVLLNKSLEEKIQKAIAKAKEKEKLIQEQSRLAQMGEMISMIAHQWRQPLSSISSAAIDLQFKLQLEVFDLESKDGRAEMLKYLDKKHSNIIEYVHFLSDTIDDFRNFFKPDKAKQVVSLTTPINKTLDIVESSMLSHRIQIIKDFQTDDELSIYHNEMTQVLLNILKNSQDVFIDKKIENRKITISTKKENDKYIISISDTGGGIPQEVLPNIFDPYFSTKNEKNGTGIGLYMSKIIIEKHHNGQLIAFNTKEGVEFKIVLDSQQKQS